MKKRKKKRIKKSIFLLIIILIGVIFYLYHHDNNNVINLYSDKSKQVIKDKKLNTINEKEYSKTLDEVLKNDIFNELFLDEYYDISYIDDKDFLEKMNKYLLIGYNGNEINDIFKLSNSNQEKLLKLEKKDFSKFINIGNFDINKIDRYNDYLESTNYNVKDVVTYVNIKLDKDFYTDTIEVDNPDSLLVLVNKYNHLPDNYTPSDLIYVDGAYGNKVPLRSVLKDNFISLQEAAKEEININLMPTTAFRNHSFQTTLYNNYVKSDGKEKADTYSARPGYSEHQTGLAIDLKNMALKNTRLTDDDYKWLQDNAYKYGFIIRFPKDKEFVTGYQFENWHIRYVGLEPAKIIYENNLTLEEYIDLYITEY